MTQILGNEKQGLVFEIVSARINDEVEDKKHVIYTLQVRHIAANIDLSPSVIERRYTDFLNLYNALKKEEPQLMGNISFPKKVLLGNFDNELISTRSTEFETLLKHVASETKLRTSRALQQFLQNNELEKAKSFIQNGELTLAVPLLENSFKLLNKVLTDRSPAVLLTLCRLLGCSMSIPDSVDCLKWANLALHRYEGVSDSDLLGLYVPLLNVGIMICDKFGKNKEVLEQRMRELKLQGVAFNENTPFLQEVDKVEQKIFGS